jgi:hypothetical protein
MGTPQLASDLIEGASMSGGCRSGMEMFGEHGFSVRDQGPAEGRARFWAKLRWSPKWGLRRISFSGSIAVVQTYDIPRPCRDTGPPSLAGFVFLGFILQIGANRLT